MKLPLVAFLLTVSSASAFAPQPPFTSPTRHAQPPRNHVVPTSLNLFGGGGGNKDAAGAKKGPGMMDQMAMFKKAADMAQKKNKLDKELAAETFEASSENGKVTATCKFSPSKNPMDPQPEYETTALKFDEEWYESASAEDLSKAVKEAVLKGVEAAALAVTEKYKVLEEDLKGAMGALGGTAPKS